jgi:uncharacterized membrane protein YbhN (UPF0104 family)
VSDVLDEPASTSASAVPAGSPTASPAESAAESPAEAPAEAPEATLVIEDGVIPRRLRRPLDLARLVIALLVAAAVVLVAYFATETTEGLTTDISTGARLLPDIVVLLLNVIGGIGTLGLPIAAAVSLIVRGRLRQLFDALLALLLAAIALTGGALALSQIDAPRLQVALAGTASTDGVATAPILGGLIAFITVARLMGRRPWNVLSVLVIGSLLVVTVLSSGIALAGVGLSIAIGWAIGLATRYVAGTPTTRPSGIEVAQALDRGGYPITVLRARESTARGRRYLATTRSGASLQVTVLDRDLEGAGLARAIWTSLRLRDDRGSEAFNMRRWLDHAALVAYAAEAAGAPEPRLLLASEVGPDSALLAYEHVEGVRLSDLDEVTDEDLRSAWRALRTLHENQISHRSLIAQHLLRAEDGAVWLIGGETGGVASSDVAQRIDIAELLVTLAMLSDADRAVEAGREVLGTATLSRALPALQPVALSPLTRRLVRKRKDLMVALRDSLAQIRPDARAEQIRFERVRPRTLVMIVVGTIGGYFLLTQLAQVDFIALFTTANWAWVALGFVLTVITFVGAAWSLSGFVPERVALHRTIVAQLAGSFATLVSPPTIGSIAINVRFLQRSGLHPVLAAASVGVAQVMAFVFHILLLFAFGIAAGTQADQTFDPPDWLVIGVIAIALLAIALLAIPAVRRLVVDRVRPTLKEVLPRLVTVVQRPIKLVEGIGGILLLNGAFIGVLYACVMAFDGELSLAVVAVVYLAGATLGQAAPTPGGLGAVEAALAAGLTAGGLDGGIAVSAVLLFRLLTFWIPTIPGYWSFNWLTRKGLL